MDASALTVKIERAFLDLGDTPDTVAAYLEAQGCRAEAGYGVGEHLGLATECPVAVYLRRTLAVEWVSVCQSHAIVRTGGARCEAKPPKAVADFITRMDDGRYPSLLPVKP